MNIPELIPPPKPSTNVLGIGYDKVTRILYISFKNTGIYSYADVPEKVYSSLLSANSIGHFIATQLAPNHLFTKIKKYEINKQ